MHVLIIGAGLTGLALAIGLRKSGHQVTVVERNTHLEEVGAGIQLPANSSRILGALGILDEVRKCCAQPQDLTIRSYTGTLLYAQNLSPTVEECFGYPHLLIHRADLRRVLYDSALAAGVIVRLGASAEAINFDAVSVSLSTGQSVTADLIVGADGEHSLCREALLGRKDPPKSSGDVVYRIAIAQSAMEADPELSSFLDPPRVHAWYGPASHAVAYQLSKGGIFNVVLTLPESEGTATIGAQVADVNEVRSACSKWDPCFRRLLDRAERVLKWTLLQTDVLTAWHHPGGHFLLLGDAAHATLPYLAQGAALAFESAQTLSILLSTHPSPELLPSLLASFSTIRIPRAAAIRARSKHMHDICQLLDGAEQLERDRILREEQPMKGFPNPWADPEWAEFMWGFEVEREVSKIRHMCGAMVEQRE
ncbi:MAG: hypothetical protein M1821_005200 [Bathelium mastoideum]|nr:MAG: hypothetical protein M1821_005200 [Bathelium mastoideum]